MDDSGRTNNYKYFCLLHGPTVTLLMYCYIRNTFCLNQDGILQMDVRLTFHKRVWNVVSRIGVRLAFHQTSVRRYFNNVRGTVVLHTMWNGILQMGVRLVILETRAKRYFQKGVKRYFTRDCETGTWSLAGDPSLHSMYSTDLCGAINIVLKFK